MFRKQQKSPKRIKIFEYVKNNLDCNGFLVLQEIHSYLADKKKWIIQLKGTIFFSYAKTNSCGAAICYIRNNKANVLDKES